jgi:hypothetical protein
MYIEASLVLQSYMPLKLEKGMWFLQSDGDGFKVVELEQVPRDMDEYIREHGAPMQPMLMVFGNPNVASETFLLATPEQIGWFDEGDDEDDMYDITVDEVNNILDETEDALCDVEIEDMEHPDDPIIPVLYEGKVAIRYLQEEDDEEDDDNDEDEDEEDDYCGHCNGSGEGMTDGSSCSMCGGSGEYRRYNDDY